MTDGKRLILQISPEAARVDLVSRLGLDVDRHPPGPDGLRALLTERRCIQLDPLDRIGTNADLVAMARVDGIGRGDVFRYLYPQHAFEHFAKERCLLPASAFPAYRDQAIKTPEWRSTRNMRQVPPKVLDAVLAEVERRGPCTSADLADHGRVEASNWSGWKGTSKAGTLALRVLWTQCRLVTCGRSSAGHIYDLPRRALGTHQDPAPSSFERWGVLERIAAAGLLPRSVGPHWSMLKAARTSGTVDALLASGEIIEVQIKGSRRRYLAAPDFPRSDWPEPDDRMRILGPLDPLLWSRPLVKHVFGFEYVWEVYKPAERRRWGWYVTPLLHRGQLVGRFEGHMEAGEVVVDTLWREDGVPFDDRAFQAALERHSASLSPTDRP